MGTMPTAPTTVLKRVATAQRSALPTAFAATIPGSAALVAPHSGAIRASCAAMASHCPGDAGTTGVAGVPGGMAARGLAARTASHVVAEPLKSASTSQAPICSPPARTAVGRLATTAKTTAPSEARFSSALSCTSERTSAHGCVAVTRALLALVVVLGTTTVGVRRTSVRSLRVAAMPWLNAAVHAVPGKDSSRGMVRTARRTPASSPAHSSASVRARARSHSRGVSGVAPARASSDRTAEAGTRHAWQTKAVRARRAAHMVAAALGSTELGVESVSSAQSGYAPPAVACRGDAETF
mmetsp:Transcript_8399/g.26202  ORF Transcript_8399/g.26202 Transcript_8399/m.26202 type:complete len:297 (-) Transcript_8399:992-1882(-)